MAFGGFDFGRILVDIGVSSGKKRRAEQKAERREKRVAGAQSQQAGDVRRREAKDRLSLIRTQFGATTASEQRGTLGEPIVGRRRLTV